MAQEVEVSVTGNLAANPSGEPKDIVAGLQGFVIGGFRNSLRASRQTANIYLSTAVGVCDGIASHRVRGPVLGQVVVEAGDTVIFLCD